MIIDRYVITFATFLPESEEYPHLDLFDRIEEEKLWLGKRKIFSRAFNILLYIPNKHKAIFDTS